ncbi:DUF1643 domain-containing protein [uncultured Nitratireductor sp.]|uniref:DUF1643 domain-containing protein n=1 Tax=uncultured Nitratireductor sp. TaxID=520953 RepID=UPI0025E18622|nr:DUF1643 domain-containing protein [uncultured Nitratireductor sp.]
MSAVPSECQKYRYRLDREIDFLADGPVYAFFGVNPSTADATIDDATVRKWKGFVTRWGGSRFIVGNVFAYRATDVKELAKATDPIGPDNFDHLFRICDEADILVPCWGSRSKLPKALRYRLDWALNVLAGFGKPLMTFGASKGGDPLHPLMLGYETTLRALEDQP